MSQVTLQPKQMQSKPTDYYYKKEFAVQGFLHTKGYGVGVRFGEIRTYYRTNFYHIDFGMIKHPREHRPNNQVNQFQILSRPYIYGKQNSFFQIRVGKGTKRYLSERAKRRGVAIGYSYELGPSLGILKPYYLDVLYTEAGQPQRIQSVKYSESVAPYFLNTDFIDGYAGFWKGIDEIKFLVGGHLRGAAHFSWGERNQFIRGLEAGLLVDFYFRKVPIMVVQENTPVFINLFLNLQLGRRY